MKQTGILIVAIMWTVGAFAQSNHDFLVVSTFHQGAANNCASIALIKAAMLKYGYKNMFSTKKEGDKYLIQLRDGINLRVSEDERVMAVNLAKFETTDSLPTTEKDSVLFYAYLAYASIAKYIQNYGYWGCQESNFAHYPAKKNYVRALTFISRRSFCTDRCYKLLGLKILEGKIFDYTATTSLPEGGVILYSDAHAVATFGSLLDCHGDWLQATPQKVCYNYFKWYLVLE